MTFYAAIRVINKNSWIDRILNRNPTPSLFYGKFKIPEEFRDEFIIDFYIMPAIRY
jgi:hypothetical protein